MERPGLPALTARRGWLAVAALVTAYELSCPKGELLSEGCHRGIDAHPLLVKGAVGITALHLMGVLPSSIDPFTQGLKLVKGHGQ